MILKNLLLTITFLPQIIFSQNPCGGFMGVDPCSAEYINTDISCNGSAETFQTNGCNGTGPNNSSCINVNSNNLVWGTFVITQIDTYTISWTASQNRDIAFALYQFTDPCAFPPVGEVEVACVDNGGNGVDESLSISLTPGTYYVCGESSGNLDTSSEICVHSPNVAPVVTASDCIDGVNVCTNLNFQINPNGQGNNTAEIPPSGSIGNPMYDGSVSFNPWGTNNFGCLQIGESNSTWMYVNISGSGSLEFTFGGNNTQTGFYDWIMYPANVSCGDIASNTTAPVRCNWNAVPSGGTGLAGTIPSGGDPMNFEPPLNVTAGEVYIICFSNYSSTTTSVPLEFGGTASVSCNLLGVTLLDFTAVTNNQEVELTWSTGSEENSDYFSIERSTNGEYFSEIGRIDCAGYSTELINYSYTDKSPVLVDFNYYRLKQVDNDGSFNYSPIEAARVTVDKFFIYPNPSKGEIFISNPDRRTLNVSVLTPQGKIIKEINDSSKIVNLKLTSVKEGIYVIFVKDRNGLHVSRVFIRS